MATSSFKKQFILESEKAEEFIEEMNNEVCTLHSDFSSKLVHEKDLKDQLTKALK